jgi:Ca-activated chloride channel family protein
MALGWDDLWQRRDQQAAAALDSGDYERALTTAESPARIGTAKFRLGDYAAAAEAFAAGDDAEHAYNRGNALARAGQYEQAIAAYDQALGKAPDHADARYNKEQVERLLQQQQQQQQQQSGQGQQDEAQQDSNPTKTRPTKTRQDPPTHLIRRSGGSGPGGPKSSQPGSVRSG